MNLTLTIVYMIVVLIVSVVKTSDGVETFAGMDKVLHFLLYGLMGLLWIRVFLTRRQHSFGGGRPKGVVLKAVAITFLFGLIIEFVQGFLPAREASLYDALANGAGALSGVLLYTLINRCVRIS
ncbi:MAG: VanZ family protein [Thermodesulfobacteriota bacterium]